jgi:5-methylcytosine-specific restriction endonuclease McrA
MYQTKTLKLDASYRPIEIIDAIEALILCIMDKASAIENYGKKVYSQKCSFELPAVIVLKRLVKFKYNNTQCNRNNILWRDKNTCQYCGHSFDDINLTLDHIIPKSFGGTNSWKNIVTACKLCNQKKGNKTPIEANMKLIKMPKRPLSTVLNRSKMRNVDELWKNYLWEFK